MQNQKSTPGVKASEGVSTLDLFKRCSLMLTTLFLLALSTAPAVYAQTNSVRQGHSTLDILDPSFNAQISTASYAYKEMRAIAPLPDGKILVAGRFNSYNGVAIGALVRLNEDGSLDTTFNNNVIAAEALPTEKGANRIVLLANGKILVAGSFTLTGETARRGLVRLNADGTLDTSFAYNVVPVGLIKRVAVKPNGKIVLGGDTWSTPNGNRGVVQLNPDGTFDATADFPMTLPASDLAVQGNKVLVTNNSSNLCRFNEDGSLDPSFTCRSFLMVSNTFVQPNGKVVVHTSSMPLLRRFNEDGSDDPTFQYLTTSLPRVAMQENGNLVIIEGTQLPLTVKRLLPDGIVDPTFIPYLHSAFVPSMAVQPDGRILLGDYMFGSVPANGFRRVNADGTPDASFDTGTGFQYFAPGLVYAVAVQTDNKILISGSFDLVNNTSRNRIARLNEDGTLDHSFQISTTATNRFLSISQFFNLALQSDGKIIVSGHFNYLVNGVSKWELVRLNEDGSIDPSFNVNVPVWNYSAPTGLGNNRVIAREDGKILVGTTRLSVTEPAVPVRLNSDGSRDTSLNSTFLSNSRTVSVFDLAVQPDGRILIVGYHNDGEQHGFVARLNDDGSVDSTFQGQTEDNKYVKSVALQPDGRILFAKSSVVGGYAVDGRVVRLNDNGTIDASFNDGVGANGKINALLLLPNGKILVGGSFTQFDNQPRQNLALLKSDGRLDAALVNVNQEVLSLALDNEGRILVGGAFTVVNTGGSFATRTYVARLLASTQNGATRTRFDFDGDRRADLAVFDNLTGTWSIRLSTTNQTSTKVFGQQGDITAPADFDGDGKADIAVYRPAEGIFYLSQSSAGFRAVRWGALEDKPVPADYDGDGRADIAVWRPSNGVWYILNSQTNQLRAVHFGKAGDVALNETDFDGDGQADIAVYRPSTGAWYWLESGANNQLRAILFGQSGDIASAADYNADGKTDFAVFRPNGGVWYRQLSTPNGGYTFSALPFGQSGDVPVVADYNGDGAADISIRRADFWHLLLSGQGHTGSSFGRADEQAIPAPQP